MKKAIIFVLVIFSFLTSCRSFTTVLGGDGIIVDVHAKAFEEVEKIPESYGYLTFYRPYKYAGAALRISISSEKFNKTVFLVNDGYWDIFLTPGDYILTFNVYLNDLTKPRGESQLNITINEGIEYYFTPASLFSNKVNFDAVSKTQALKELRKCRRIPGTLPVDHFVENIQIVDLNQAKPSIVEDEKQIADTDVNIDRSTLPIVTVFDFEYEGVSEKEANFIVDFLGGALFDTGNYRIIDRAQRDAILSEIQFSISGCTDESCQLEAGKLLAADYMVTGSLGQVGSRFVLNAKLIDVELGETVLSARDIYSDIDAMLDGCDELAVQLSIIDD